MYFDIVGIYTPIPVRPSISLMCGPLRNSGAHEDTTTEFDRLISACLDTHAVCLFRDAVYRFSDGLPVDNLLSSLGSEVFLNQFESDIFTQHSSYGTQNVHLAMTQMTWMTFQDYGRAPRTLLTIPSITLINTTLTLSLPSKWEGPP